MKNLLIPAFLLAVFCIPVEVDAGPLRAVARVASAPVRAVIVAPVRTVRRIRQRRIDNSRAWFGGHRRARCGR